MRPSIEEFVKLLQMDPTDQLDHYEVGVQAHAIGSGRKCSK